MRLRISFKLAILLALVGALAAGLTGFYAYEASRKLQLNSARTELLTSTQMLARRITLMQGEITRNLQMLTRHPVALATLQQGHPSDADQVATLFDGVMTANPAYLQVRLISADGHGMERVRLDRIGSLAVRLLGDDLQEKGHFPYVADALRLPLGGTWLSRISINHETGTYAGLEQPLLQLAMPVMDAQGAARGVVVINVDLNGLFGLLAADLPGSYQLYLANGAGDVLIHPDATQTFGFDRGRRVLLQSEFPETVSLFTGQAAPVLIDRSEALPGRPPQVAAFIPQSIESPDNDNRLVIGLAQPLSFVMARSDEVGSAIVRIVLGLCALSAALAVLVSRAVSRPINAVTEAARRFEAGEAAGELPVGRQDEIGSLARSFQKMQTRIAQQLLDLKDKQDQLEHLSHHDTLTDLPNRRLFSDRLAQALAYARRNGEEVTVLFLDLDDFKRINDEFGHEAGDLLLQGLARRLQAQMREVDTVARLGGDEFVVLLGTPAHPVHAGQIAEKLMALIGEPVESPMGQLQVGVSVGISQYPRDGETADQIMANADRAMYAAKKVAGSSYRFAADTPPRSAAD